MSKKLDVNGLNRSEFVTTFWRIVPAVGVLFEEVLKPAYWDNVAARMNAGDEVSVFPEDKSYFAKLLVIDKSQSLKQGEAHWAKVILTQFVQIAEEAAAIDESEYEIKFRGAAKWSVIRNSDKKVLKDGLSSKEEAAACANELSKTLAA